MNKEVKNARLWNKFLLVYSKIYEVKDSQILNMDLKLLYLALANLGMF